MRSLQRKEVRKRSFATIQKLSVYLSHVLEALEIVSFVVSHKHVNSNASKIAYSDFFRRRVLDNF